MFLLTRGLRLTVRGGMRWLAVVLVLTPAVAVAVLRVAVVDLVEVASASMQPTYCAGDRLLVLTVGGTPARGDVVTFAAPDTGETILKRVVAVGGEELEVRDGILHVAGVPVPEDYVDPAAVDATFFGPVVVPRGQVFVLGDDRELSVDSRDFGPVPVTSVRGRVLWRWSTSC